MTQDSYRAKALSFGASGGDACGCGCRVPLGGDTVVFLPVVAVLWVKTLVRFIGLGDGDAWRGDLLGGVDVELRSLLVASRRHLQAGLDRSSKYHRLWRLVFLVPPIL